MRFKVVLPAKGVAKVEMPSDVLDDVRKRLHRIGGQVGAIERMLDDGRECKDVIIQISAATKALEKVGFKLIATGLTYCLADPEEAAKNGYRIEEVQKMFMKLS